MQATEKHFYTRYALQWEKALLKAVPLESKPNTNIFDHAYLLPLRRRRDLKCNAFEGGVLTDKQNFVTGIQRSRRHYDLNFACTKGYRVENARYIDEKVVFGGVFYGHFGHVIIDSCTRLWHFAENDADGLRRVFVQTPDTKFCYGRFFDLAGMDWEIIEEPTQFREVVVPEEAYWSFDRGKAAWLEWWDYLRKKALKTSKSRSSCKKIYLTRTNFHANDGINEVYYENCYKNLGYEVISPEQLPLEDQICIIAHATHIVCTMGTLAHMLVFASDGADITLLLRSPSSVMPAQLTINQLRRFRWRCIEATLNPLPVSQSNGAFLYAPTPFFREYCHDTGLPEPPECIISDEMVIEYLKKWAENYKKPICWDFIKNFPCFDFLASLNYFFTGEELDKATYTKP